jgi:LysR family glycine cleavage system transcriptional activator
MKRSHLPLHALRVFEVAARHESFALAANELCITQPAVSKQVVIIEEFLGLQLFERKHRSVQLTKRGRRLAARLSDALNRIDLALETARSEQTHDESLTVTVESDLARFWFFPRLHEFEREHPAISISVLAQIDPAGLDATVADCAIVWGDGGWPQYQYELLFNNAAFPVCTPQLAAQLESCPDALRQLRLIHDRTTEWWRLVAVELNMPDLDWTSGPIYNQTNLCLEAALRGDGITIGDIVSSQYYLRQKLLVRPFPILLPSPVSYYFLWQQMAANKKNVLALRDWLRAQAADHLKCVNENWS